ncbi:uncharacterized protein LOC106073311 isoform X2 [Biomphalaria glabrata]|uniref:Uncharacterized protein LOC106073311 isoform X2 n=1 Tax=Biomphalaria glabrata TaxID=6526 RepID=A0A9W2Z335_BIOGL|nr:uncharacterized protein LOC106073311 isoform X2 [Biomphalaria glabrata]
MKESKNRISKESHSVLVLLLCCLLTSLAYRDSNLLCHCKNNQCYPTGACLPNVTCDDGYFGENCLYENVAKISTTNASYLVDSNVETCSPFMEKKSFAHFRMARPMTFTFMRLAVKGTNHIQDPFSKVALVFEEKEGGKEECSLLRLWTQSTREVDLFCPDVTKFDGVTLQWHLLEVCEVYISLGRNVAIGEQVHGSSFRSRQTTSTKGVDGDLGSCYKTAAIDPEPMLAILFSAPKVIGTVRLHSSCEDTVLPFGDKVNVNVSEVTPPPEPLMLMISAFDADEEEVAVVQGVQLTCEPQDVYIPALVSVSSVVIELDQPPNGNGSGFILCEVEIFGDCPIGKAGLLCKENCPRNCQRQCSVIKHNCQRCVKGFFGAQCETRVPLCGKFKYGDRCQKDCGNCARDGSCSAMTRKCTFGCLERYYGETCEKYCGNCKEAPNCSMRLEPCPQGCIAPFTGLYCNETCGGCAGKGGCHQFTQKCAEGCLSVFEGTRCNLQLSPSAVIEDVEMDDSFVYIAMVTLSVVILVLYTLLTNIQAIASVLNLGD